MTFNRHSIQTHPELRTSHVLLSIRSADARSSRHKHRKSANSMFARPVNVNDVFHISTFAAWVVLLNNTGMFVPKGICENIWTKIASFGTVYAESRPKADGTGLGLCLIRATVVTVYLHEAGR